MTALPETPTTPSTPAALPPLTPLTPLASPSQESPTTPHLNSSISRSSSQQNVIDTDSGKSSCSPALLDRSFDSGIGVEVHDLQLHKRLQHCKRILLALERDKDVFRKLRERLIKIVDKKNKNIAKQEVEEELQKFCNVCCTEIHNEDAKNFVICCTCNKHVCRDIKCADWMPKTAEWECQLCHSFKESLAHTSSWVAEQIYFNQQKHVYPMRARSEIYIPISDCNESSMQFESVSQIGVNSNSISAEQKLKIREYVEELVANMLGGSLDNISVLQMSKSENYLPGISSTHNSNQGLSPTHNNNLNDFSEISQVRLRQLIETILAETLRTPVFSSGAVSEVALETRSNAETIPFTNGDVSTPVRRHRTEHYFEPKVYQNLLATAVLNKIIDKQGNGRLLSESTPDLSAHIADENFNVENQSISSCSSVEPRSDSSFTDNEEILNNNNIDNTTTGAKQHHRNLDNSLGRESALSDYVASHIVPLPDLSAPPTESEEDDFMSVTSSKLGDGTWEDNWLFKKKRSSLNNATTANGCGMLVPAPVVDVRAQIGDRTADEISDLSEIGSDTDDSSLDLLHGKPVNDRLLNKHIIGGENTKIVLDELIECASMVSGTLPAENEPIYAETKNENIATVVPGKAEAYNEHINKLANSVETTHKSPYHNENPTKTAEVQMPLSGSIAEREYMKWNNAVEMPNNPYAPEALKRRISGSQERFLDLPNISPSTEQNPIELLKSETEDSDAGLQSRENDYKRYSRDYYINDITKNSSATNTKCPSPTPSTETRHDIDIVINEPLTPAVAQPNTGVYQAIPAQVVVEDHASIETLSNQSMQSVNTTSSEDSDTVRIYDFNKQETTKIRQGTKLQAAVVGADATVDGPITKKARPTELSLDGAENIDVAANGTTPLSPTSAAGVAAVRGSTPTAFKFLQPKRKLIDPSQVLSFDEEMPEEPEEKVEEKPVIEEEVARALPSVKALARAFIIASNKNTRSDKRWPIKPKIAPVSPISPKKNILETSPSIAEIAEDATISSDLSSLETDPPINKEVEVAVETVAEAVILNDQTKENALPTPNKDSTSSRSNAARKFRTGFLRSNIAFFENLKFK